MNKSVKRAPYLILAVAVTLGLFPKGASARSVACLAHSGGVTCFFSRLACRQRVHDFSSGNPSCVDFAMTDRRPGSVSLQRERGGSASITIDGKRTRIASEELESFLDRSMREARAAARSRDGRSEKEAAERFRRELEAFLEADGWLVSDRTLSDLSRELRVPIGDG